MTIFRVLFVCALAFVPGALQAQGTADPVKGLKYRSIGPYRGGRVTAVAGIASQPNTYFMGPTGGGVFKTTDGGANWTPVTDGQIQTGSVGALAVSESDPNVIYVGMGEVPIRGNVSHGDGVYRSNDSGKTWKHAGLGDSRHIGRIRIHPRNPDVAFAAVLGHIFVPKDGSGHPTRGVYRTTDGGKSWRQVLSKGRAGAVDLAMDPSNPDVLYASFWDVKRTPWSLESGGPDSGLFKTTDGGETWKEITRNPGGPKGMVGKIGVTVSAANPERLWAIIEAEDGGVFRSDNGGANWTRVNEQRSLRQRAWYYSRIYADPKRVNTVYVLNVGFHRSDDGGRTFTPVRTLHGDNHDLWIAPNDSDRMIQGNDGGAHVSYNAGRTWSPIDNQATSQFYRVAIDNEFPYWIYGAQQDNSTLRIASRSGGGGLGMREWHAVGGGESGWIAPYPKDWNVVFAGSYGGLLTRYDHRTQTYRNVTVYPDNPMGYGAEGMKYRFQWNFPILFSPHDPDLLYAGGNMLFQSRDQGQSWEPVSGDLTRNDKSKQGPSGGPITKDNTGVEYYCTIFTVAESLKRKGVIWTGSDDGLVHVTEDGGKSWANVTPKDMPEWIQINSIEASPHDPATAYVAATMYKHDDFAPYLYKTSDYGKSWTKIVNGVGKDAFTRVVREDPARKGLLYAGTETGLYVSFDDGANWRSLQLNLPVVPITDLAVHAREKDLVVATQGRSFWVLDDLTVLHQLRDDTASKPVHLFAPEDTYRFGAPSGLPPVGPAGQNAAAGVVVHYWLKEKTADEVTLEFLDAKGALIRKFSSKDQPRSAGAPAAGDDDDDGPRFAGPEPKPGTDAGLNRFVWNMRYPEATRFPGMILWAGMTMGPLAVPGEYKVRLKVGGASALEQPFTIKRDPRLRSTPEDYQKQFSLLTQIRDKVSAANEGVIRIRALREQLNAWRKRMDESPDLPGAKAVAEAAKALVAKLTAVEEELYQTKNQSNQDPLNYPIRLNNKLAALAGVVAGSDAAPTRQSYVVFEDLAPKVNEQLAKLDQLLKSDLAAFNKLVRDQNVPAVVPAPPKSQP